MKLTFGITVMLIGLATVFVGLILLIAIIKLISIFMQGISANKAAKPAPAAPAPAPAPVEEPVEEEEETEDPYIPFVIAAAIAACESEENKKFVVRRVRRVSSSWSDNARREQILNY